MPSEEADSTIVLVGPMATGKSAIGEALAALLHGTHVDSDAVFVSEHGVIQDYFDAHGEASFRDLEEGIIASALDHDGDPGGVVILSLGGGSLGREATRERLKSKATVVYLETDLATVLPRIARDTGRPMLAGDAAERWLTLFEARRPLYEAVADVSIDARHGEPLDLALTITQALGLDPESTER